MNKHEGSIPFTRSNLKKHQQNQVFLGRCHLSNPESENNEEFILTLNQSSIESEPGRIIAKANIRASTRGHNDHDSSDAVN
ncbi:MAG: hypothetical protein ACXWIU_05660 [Limisphaerales bacterium]